MASELFPIATEFWEHCLAGGICGELKAMFLGGKMAESALCFWKQNRVGAGWSEKVPLGGR